MPQSKATNANGKSNVELDLDALAPKQVQINFQGKLIKVTPPNLKQYAHLIELGSEMEKIDEDSTDINVVMPIYEKAKDLIDEIIPDFKGVNLNYLQLLAVFRLLGDLGAPQNDKALKELEKRGIKLTGKKQKKGGKAGPKASTSRKQ